MEQLNYTVIAKNLNDTVDVNKSELHGVLEVLKAIVNDDNLDKLKNRETITIEYVSLNGYDQNRVLYPLFGLCSNANISSIVNYSDNIDEYSASVENLKDTLFATWPHYSGDDMYPVSDQEEYEHESNFHKMYENDKRIQLAHHIISILEEYKKCFIV